MQPYTTQDISANRSYTPDGFLLCKNVSIGRTGVQIYKNGELGNDTDGNPIVGPTGSVRVTRDAEQVFAPEAMASFLGKPVTVLHPSKLVTPADYAKVSKGTILNPRRGTGDQAEELVADLLITDKPTIDALDGNQPEVSSGYDAAYVKTGVGEYNQISIVGNHVAAVPKGRCGSRCAIGDHDTMSKTTLAGVIAAVLGKAKTPEEVTAALTADMDAPTGDVSGPAITVNLTGTADADTVALTAALAAANAKIAELTADAEKEESEEEKAERLKKEKEEGTKDALPDAAALAQFQTTLAFLSPGAKLPTLDSADAQATLDAICTCKREALTAVYKTPNGATVLDKIVSKGTDFSTLDGHALDSAFFQAAGALRTLNNGMTANLATATIDGKKLSESDQLAKINADNRARYAKPAI